VETFTSSTYGRRRRRGSRLRMMAVLVGPLVLAGCASNPAQPATGAAGVDLAKSLLHELVLPHGAGPLTMSGGVPTAFQSSDLGCAVANREQYWQVPGLSISEAQAWFEQHPPAGLRVAGTGSGGDRSGETMTEVDYTVGSGQAIPQGSELVVEAVTEPNGSAVRASAQVVPATGCSSGSHFPPVHPYSG